MMTITATLPLSEDPLPLSEDPFKAHILDYKFKADDYFSEDDDHHYEEDDEDWADLEEEYEKKEDEDVAVFRALIDHLPLNSLLHLLQGHAKISQMEVKPTITSVEVYDQNHHQGMEVSCVLQESKQQEEEETKQPEKQFRWATNDDYTVKSDIYEIESIKENRHLWLNGYELTAIRNELVRQIRFFVIHHQERIETLDRVIIGDGPEHTIEECIKELTKHSTGRGLEGHMSRVISETRRKHVGCVLSAQKNCNFRKQSYDATIEILREQSLVNGQKMRLYAQRMAKSDEIEALTASMSSWGPTKAFA